MRETPIPHIPLEGDPTPTVHMKLLLSRQHRGFPASVEIPDNALTQERAAKNHGQTLQRLNSRGGLCPAEFIALMEDTKFVAKSVDECAGWFIRKGLISVPMT